MTEEHQLHTRRTTCRGCDGTRLHPFLELGDMPLANAFLGDPSEFAGEREFPLDVYRCRDCSLVQLLDVIDTSVLFSHYLYLTGVADTISVHQQEYARTVSDYLQLDANDLVVEIASNDGSFLQHFRERGQRVLGIEPAKNIAAIALERGIDTLDAFFDEQLGQDLSSRYPSARAVIANNVLAHVDEPIGFLRGCRHLIGTDGYVIIEVPYLADLLERLEYDTIYHEHLSYFSVTALQNLFERAGLWLSRVDRFPIHGGSLRLYATTTGEHAPNVHQLVAAEHAQGMAGAELYAEFAARVRMNREQLRTMLQELRSKGHSVAAYGAPAKGNTLLNFCQIDSTQIPFIADRNPLKVGKYTPGSHIEVKSVSALIEEQPDYVLILAWTLAEEITHQLRGHLGPSTRFIVPIPTPRVV